MSYKLEKPYTETERLDFIVEYNHNQSLSIEETDIALFALEPWEKIVDGEVVDNTEEYEAEKVKQEAERIAKLSLTKREVFLAIYQDKGITPEQIRAQITDPAALIEFDYAEKYYRGNPLIDVLGQSLGYSKEDLDNLFDK